MMTLRLFGKLASASAAALMLNGCASLLLGNGETPPRFTLLPPPEETPADIMKYRLVISDPQSEAAFDTSRISYSPEPLRFEYYTDGEWTDQLPLLWGIFLQRSFENDGRIETVGNRVSVPLGDFVLRTDIRAFNIEDRGGIVTAKVSYSAKLFNFRNEAVATRIFSESQPVSGDTLTDFVEAMNIAARRGSEETVDWVVAEMRENPPATQQGR